MKKRLIKLSTETQFNSEVRFDEKNQKWVAERSLTEQESFLTEEEAKSWIQQKEKNEKPFVSEPMPTAPKKDDKLLSPPPPAKSNVKAKEPLKKESSPSLPVGEENPKVTLPIANTRRRLIKTV